MPSFWDREPTRRRRPERPRDGLEARPRRKACMSRRQVSTSYKGSVMDSPAAGWPSWGAPRVRPCRLFQNIRVL